MVSDSPSSRTFKSAHYLLACSLIVSLTFHDAREVQGECRAELARAMLSRSLHSQCIPKCTAKLQQKTVASKFRPP